MHMLIHDFHEAIEWAKHQLTIYGEDVDPGHWQGVSTEGHPDLTTKELMNLNFTVPVYNTPTLKDLRVAIRPNLPWADDHFLERVSREPLNPGEQYKNWPWWHGQVDETQRQGAFTHTYMERFWPKLAGPLVGVHPEHMHERTVPHQGIRYEYGDLDDVVNLLLREPLTRQATFPIFFPEDTGAVHGGRIPCTLHYHFLLRNNQLNMWYPIRSCDYVRHFRDDLYMAARLMLWVIEECRRRAVVFDKKGDGFIDPPWDEVTPGLLFFTAYSFHYHKGDMVHVRG